MTLSVLLSLVGFLLTIGIVVMIHEGGHYLAAKWLGFGVKRFSIGMGRVLWRRRAWDTEFAVSLLPIGGYVALKRLMSFASRAASRPACCLIQGRAGKRRSL